ncbi:hypothetical protein [Xanthobacter sediminis]|uniref:hypothetical protein n=1 Tax=Xanthobacter sediminis TaxID=3119926 RepID=UPI0037293259
MVTSVGNNTTSILTLFRTGADGAADANSETLAKIQQLAKEAEQLKAGASPAQVQGASVATNAWIGASETAQKATATTGTQTAATEATDTRSEKTRYVYKTPVQLADSIQQYNNAIIARVQLQAELGDSQAQLAATADPIEIARLTKRTEFLEIFAAYYEQIYTDYPSDIEYSAQIMNARMNINGTLLIKNDDGTYGLGKFRITLKDNGAAVYFSDNKGSIFENQKLLAAEPDSWREAVSTINGKFKQIIY